MSLSVIVHPRFDEEVSGPFEALLPSKKYNTHA
jgi:hypothetical protein